MLWNDFRNQLNVRVGDELWGQWVALGVRGTGEYVPTRVDLEALLLGTWGYGRRDPRLFDEALSWCCRFGELVNVKRLKKLLAEVHDPSTLRIAGAWNETLARRGDVDWNLNFDLPEPEKTPETLFLNDELMPQSTGSKRDEVFEEFQLIRGPFAPRDYANPPDFTDPQLSQLFARKLMGASCRSEVFGLLVHDVDVTTTELAQMTLYSQRLIQDILRDMNEGGSLDWNPGRGRTTRPSLRPRVRDGFQMAMTNGRSSGGWHGQYEQRDWPGFFLGSHTLWTAILRISQSGFEGFKAQSLLSDGLAESVEYHSRGELQTIYQPRLAASSMEELLKEGALYVDSLFPTDSRVR